jgi:hypothetical protein
VIEAFEVLGENVRHLGREWGMAIAGWRDESAAQFERDYWDRFMAEAREIEWEAQRLRETLERAVAPVTR